jgi:ADP-ribose pyrophosphatase YjhB (NUDIX family)
VRNADRPGYGTRHPAVAALLAAHQPAALHATAWADGALPLRIGAYLGTPELPEAFVISVRCLVRVDTGVLICENPGGRHPWPGGRREPGESYADTAAREVHEETGWLLERGSIRRLGWLHVEFATALPADHPYPHPDVLQLVLTATAAERDSTGPTADWHDHDGYELRSYLLPLTEARTRITELAALPFLDLIATTG